MLRVISKLRPRRFPIAEGNTIIGDQGKGHLSKDHADAMPGAMWFPEMTPYHHMRSMVIAASLPDEPKISVSSPVADQPFSVPYSDWDAEIIKRAAKLCGFTPTNLTDRRSKEPDDVHKISPVNHNAGRSIYE